jgi:hypothetical protein
MRPVIYSIILITVCFTVCYSQTKTNGNEPEITQILQQLAEANLKSDPSVAEKFYAENLLMTSQSGKVYNKKEALSDIKNAFEKYENSDFKFIHLGKKTVIVNYQNTRKRKSLDEAKFRVTTFWVKKKDGWKIVSLQSSRIAEPGM